MLLSSAVGLSVEPTASITAGPTDGSSTSSTTATFAFASDAAGVSFRCSLDARKLRSCTSPKTYASLSLGTHIFKVQAVSSGGAAGATASRTWTVVTGSTAGGSTGGGSAGGATVTCDQTISPGQSVSTLVNSLRAGQTGCLHAGTYTEDVTPRVSGAAGAPIAIASYPGERATLVGILYIPVGSNYLTFEHLNLVGTSAQSISVQLFGNNATLLHDDITNNHQSGSCVTISDYEGSYAAMAYNTTIAANRIHDCGLPANGAHDHGIYVAASTNAVIRDNLIWGTENGWAIQLWTSSQYSQITHNVLDGNYGGSMIIAGQNISPAFQPSSNNTINQNILTSPQTGYNVASYWSGGAVGQNNTLNANCVFGAPSGDFDYGDGGFTQTNSLHADPQYVNRANHDYRLQPTSPCLPLVGYDTAGAVLPG